MRVLLALITLLALPFAHADALDERIVREMKRHQIPGVSLLVLKEGKVVKEKGYGLANVEHQVPVTPDTVFQSGSVGKTFTAALVLLLAQDGKLSLDDPLKRHLASTPAAWDKITIRHLLNHTSGLGDPDERIDLRRDYSDEELIALGSTIPVLFAPGERFSYSNMGYQLLGFICNKAGGKFYGDQLRERIFAPLGMGTRIISEADIVPHRAAGYEPANGKLRNQAWVAPRLNTTADGSLHLTARDLAKWDQALYGDKILNASLRQASWTPSKLNSGATSDYGYGWLLEQRNGRRVIWHDGAWQGFRSQLSRFVDDKLTVIVLANSATADPGKLANLAAAHFVPALRVPPAPAIADQDPQVTERARVALSSLAAGQRPQGLAPAYAERFDAARVNYLAAVLRSGGELKKVELLERYEEAGSRAFHYRLVGGDDTLLLHYQLDKDGQVEGLGLMPE